MTRRQQVVHEIVGGFCRVCGDTAEWLEDRGRDAVLYLEATEDEEAKTIHADGSNDA